MRRRLFSALTLTSFFTLGVVHGAGCGSNSVEVQGVTAPPGSSVGGDDTGTSTGSTTPPLEAGTAAPDVTSAPDAPVSAPKQIKTIFTVVFENHDYLEIVGSSAAPYFNELIGKYGLATSYFDCNIHPSLPNYLCLISGDPQYGGLIDLNPTQSFITGSFPVDQPNLGEQLEAANIPWRSYQESMGEPCRLTNYGDYAPRHDPFLYFDGIQNGPNDLCKQTNVDYTFLANDLAAQRQRYYFITPNVKSDGHDGEPVAALTFSDSWARKNIGALMASQAYKDGGVIFIVWDEAEGRGGRSGDQVPMIVVSELIKSPGYKSNKHYSHRSYLATVEDILGLPRLDTVKNEPTLMEFFQ